VEIGIPVDDLGFDDREVAPGWIMPISAFFSAENNRALYRYDFGDDWNHDVRLEKILPRKPDAIYPVCLAGSRACPPEDCGGTWGYEDMLQILEDPDHDEYEGTIEWLGEDFDPDEFNAADIRFSDPEKRWRYAFLDEEDDDEFAFDPWDEDDDFWEEDYEPWEYDDGAGKDDDDLRRALRRLSRQRMFEIWESAKSGDLDGLTEEEQLTARIMMDHQEEFHNDFEFADVTYDREYDPETDYDPFLHITLHVVVENQLEAKEPIEAFQFYNAMIKKRCSPHEAVHMIGAILAPLMFLTLKTGQPFEPETYKRLLKKYKTRNPQKIFDLLENETALEFPDED
jgi:hypothetical protein